MKADRKSGRPTERQMYRQEDTYVGLQAGRQEGIQTDRKTNRQAGGQEVRQTHTQTRVPINLGLVDGND